MSAKMVPDEPADIRRLQAELAESDVDLARVWTGIAGEVWARRPGWGERTLARLLRSPGLARALLVTPSLLLSWIIASLAILAVGAVAMQQTHEPWIGLLAPALAGISITFAYGPGVDPAYELSQTMAVPSSIVLLVRCLAVFGLNAVLGLVASFGAVGASGITFGWLVPMTTISALALAVALVAGSAPIGVAAALGAWAFIISARGFDTGTLAAAATPGRLIPVYLAATVGLLTLAGYRASGRHARGATWR